MLADAEYVTSSPSTSLDDKDITKAVSSSVLPSAIASNTGASFTGLNVNVNVDVLESVPSDTITVITESPT